MSEYQVDRAKWQTLTIFEQMGNIGSEVGRALRAKTQGDNERLQGAFRRGLDLFDAAADVWAAQRSPRTAEILRAREQFVRAVTTDTADPTLEGYFTQYALVARMRQFA